MPGRGFQEHPENINRNGRPKKGTAIADYLNELLDAETTVQRTRKDKNGKERKFSQKITRRQLFVEVMFQRALNGSNAAARMILNYADGLPLMKVQQVGDGGLSRIELWDITAEDLKKMPNVEGQERIKEKGE